MKEMNLREQIKVIVSILLGIGITVLSFFAFIMFLFSVLRDILGLLLFIFYISTITFLFMWNRNKTKKKYIPLGISTLCVLAAAILIGYYNYVRNIPSLNETEVNIYLYEPFNDRQVLEKSSGEAGYKIIDNLPVLDGATALYPVYAAFVNAVYPEDRYDPRNSAVLCSKTIDAYNNLLSGKADIIFCAGPSEEQIQEFKNNGIKIELIPIGREAFVFFVNKKNEVDNLSIEDIQNIYSGKIKNWKRIGGGNGNIRAYQRPDNSGSQTALKKIMGNIPIIEADKENISDGMGSIISKTAVYRNFNNAIGYSFLHFSTEMVKNEQIKLLSINNVYPSKETIQDGSYPFCDTFYAVYVEKNKMNENIKPFIEWMLSKQGQEIIEKVGYVSIIRW
ncbi:PstS family phosphate ABC transporter substrate-binding protein [Breznakiellaceae bacterium SP9]